VGGGAFFVPLFDVVAALGVRSATALSQVCVAAATLAATAARARARHPVHPGRPLVDARLALLAAPPLLLGVSLGLLLNVALPPAVLTFILLALLVGVTADAGVRAARLTRRETAAAAAAAAAVEFAAGEAVAARPRGDAASTMSYEGESLVAAMAVAAGAGAGRGACTASPDWARAPAPPSLDVELARPPRLRLRRASAPGGRPPRSPPPPPPPLSTPPSTPPSLASVGDASADGEGAGELAAPADDGGSTKAPPLPRPPNPWLPALALALLWAAMAGLQVGRALERRCSPGWWGCLGAQAALATAATAAAARAGGGAEPSPPPDAPPDALSPYARDYILTPRTTAVTIAAALVAGVIAALVGVGGGILLIPIFLALGVHPASAAATSTLLVLMSSVSAAAGQAAAGNVPASFAGAFGAASLASGAAGAVVVAAIVARTGRAAWLVWLLAAVIGGGAALTAGFSGAAAVRSLRAGGEEAAFSGFCAER
jgi:uncharacterized membrane protein YfcA